MSIVGKLRAALNRRSLSRLRRASLLVGGTDSDLSSARIQVNRAGRVTIGSGSRIEGSLSIEKEHGEIFVGDNTFVGASTVACAGSIYIGNDVLVSWGCVITDHNSHSLIFSERKNDVAEWRAGRKDWSQVRISPVVIADKAWIGMGVTILKGVTIGEGAIVGAGSVVTKSVVPWTVVAGNPASMIREIPSNER